MSRSGFPEQRVDVFFIGVGKCGTSWIHRYFVQRGDVGVPAIKEPYILNHPIDEQISMIERLWDDLRPRCDFSNLYYWDARSAQRILDHNPAARIVLTVRLPSKRVESHFAFLQRNGEYTKSSVVEYLDAGDPVDLVARSDYERVVERFAEHFPPTQLLVLPLELLAADPQAYADRLSVFLDIPSTPLAEEDTKKVLGRSTARVPVVSRLAKRAGERLRDSGQLELLAKLKESELVRRVLFSEIKASSQEQIEWPEAVRTLDAAYPAFLESVGIDPALAHD